jgi:hypothetical protein
LMESGGPVRKQEARFDLLIFLIIRIIGLILITNPR